MRDKGVSLVGSEINLLPCKASNPRTMQVGSWLPVPLPPGVRCLAEIGDMLPQINAHGCGFGFVFVMFCLPTCLLFMSTVWIFLKVFYV